MNIFLSALYSHLYVLLVLIPQRISSKLAGGRHSSLEPELRKRTSSLSTPHRAVDVAVDPAHSAILFRDARGVSQYVNRFYSYLHYWPDMSILISDDMI